jgi:hypothetical protein
LGGIMRIFSGWGWLQIVNLLWLPGNMIALSLFYFFLSIFDFQPKEFSLIGCYYHSEASSSSKPSIDWSAAEL